MMYQLNRAAIRGGMTQKQFHDQAQAFNNKNKNKSFVKKRSYLIPSMFQQEDYLDKKKVHLRQDVDINGYAQIAAELFNLHVIEDLYD